MAAGAELGAIAAVTSAASSDSTGDDPLAAGGSVSGVVVASAVNGTVSFDALRVGGGGGGGASHDPRWRVSDEAAKARAGGEGATAERYYTVRLMVGESVVAAVRVLTSFEAQRSAATTAATSLASTLKGRATSSGGAGGDGDDRRPRDCAGAAGDDNGEAGRPAPDPVGASGERDDGRDAEATTTAGAVEAEGDPEATTALPLWLDQLLGACVATLTLGLLALAVGACAVGVADAPRRPLSTAEREELAATASKRRQEAFLQHKLRGRNDDHGAAAAAAVYRPHHHLGVARRKKKVPINNFARVDPT